MNRHQLYTVYVPTLIYMASYKGAVLLTYKDYQHIFLVYLYII